MLLVSLPQSSSQSQSPALGPSLEGLRAKPATCLLLIYPLVPLTELPLPLARPVRVAASRVHNTPETRLQSPRTRNSRIRCAAEGRSIPPAPFPLRLPMRRSH